MRGLPVLAAALLFSGCLAGDPEASLTVDYPDGESWEKTFAYDPEARPTAAMYGENGDEHPDFYNVHDLLYDLGQGDGPTFTFQYFSFGDQGGFFVCSIDGQPVLDDGACPQDAGGFYEFRVDGEASQAGISQVEVEEGAAYALVWTPIEADPGA